MASVTASLGSLWPQSGPKQEQDSVEGEREGPRGAGQLHHPLDDVGGHYGGMCSSALSPSSELSKETPKSWSQGDLLP